MITDTMVAALVGAGRFEVTDAPGRPDFMRIYHALDVETAEVAGLANLRPLAVLLRDDTGAVGGGLCGVTVHSWLAIEMLFVPAAVRGIGIGRALVTLAEDAARARGCIGAHVDTYDFQAAGFYRRLGYEPFGVQENCPPGHRRIYLAKPLAVPPV